MKSGIHPVYKVVTVTCACGESFVTRSTRDDLRLEICAKCHPFFTGKQKLIDSAGRVERFEKRYKNVPKAGEQPAAGKVAAPATGRTQTPSGGKAAAHEIIPRRTGRSAAPMAAGQVARPTLRW